MGFITKFWSLSSMGYLWCPIESNMGGWCTDYVILDQIWVKKVVGGVLAM